MIRYRQSHEGPDRDPGDLVPDPDGEWVRFAEAVDAIRAARAKRDAAYTEAALARGDLRRYREALDAACAAMGADHAQFLAPLWGRRSE